MAAPVSDLSLLLKSMQPLLNPGIYTFTLLPEGAPIDPATVVAFIREPEGLSAVMLEEAAICLGLPVMFRSAWITLEVHSDLQAVGLTAAFATALGQAGISCNVVAGTHHDHIFVPHEQADRAMAALLQLQQVSA